MSFKPQKAEGILALIETIGQIAENEMVNAENAEEYAFIFGHVNMAAVLANTLRNTPNGGKVQLTLNYDTARKAYEDAQKEYAELKKECETHQISMEELFPKLFKAIDDYIDKKTVKNTKEKKSKKE